MNTEIAIAGSTRPRTKQELLEELHRALETLHPQQALLLHLRYWERLTIDAIARVVRRTWEWVDRQLDRIVRYLEREVRSDTEFLSLH